MFDKRFDEVFESFDQEPIGSGAIAQVYKAKLKTDLLPPSFVTATSAAKRRHVWSSSLVDRLLEKVPQSIHHLPPPTTSLENPDAPASTTVAIKVLHPGVEGTIGRDLAIMGFFAKALSFIPTMHWISLDDEVRVFGNMMREQLDLRHEARNLKRFEENFANRQKSEISGGGSAVSFPRPLEEYSTQRILIEQFEEAVPLEDFLKNGGGKYESQIATSGLDAFLVSS